MCLLPRLFSRSHSCLLIASLFLSYLFPWTSYDSGFVYFLFILVLPISIPVSFRSNLFPSFYWSYSGTSLFVQFYSPLHLEHRMKHWLQLVAIPNAPSSSSSQELQSLKKRISDLEKARSRSPRRSNQKQITAPSGSQMLALPAPSAPVRGQKGGKHNRRAGARNTASKGSGKGQASKDFDYLMKLPLEFRTNFHEKFHKNEICYGFQKKACKRADGTCKLSQKCVGCGGSKPTTTASASLQSSHEPLPLQSLIQFLQFLLPCPFPR